MLFLQPLALACAPLESEVVTLEIRAHSIDASERCRIETNPNVTLEALGPFPVSLRGGEVVPFHTASRALTFPAETRGAEASASDGDQSWIGYSDRRTESGINVLLWGESVGCELHRAEPNEYPMADAGQAIGYSPDAGMLLVAGGDRLMDTPLGAAAGSLTFESDTGESDLVDSNLSFPQARGFATVTPFGSGFLLAGGENPLLTEVVPERQARETAVVFDPVTRGFEGDTIELEIARTRHAAVELATGETLLVGGGRPDGDGATVALRTLEKVSPSTRRSTFDGLAELDRGRLEPSALRLDGGVILVGGGYDLNRMPVETVEFLAPDASSHASPGAERCGEPFDPCVVLEARHHRVFVALPGGGALTVGGCLPSSSPDAACEVACGVGFGCPAPDFDATWIAPDARPTEVGLVEPSCPSGAPSAPFSPERVLLSPGSDGSPWLLAFDEDADPPCRAVFRFKPWEDPPVFAPAELDLDAWPDPRTKLTSLGPDVFVWLSASDPPSLTGVRAGVRGALSQNETLLGTDPSAPFTPLHLVRDRASNAPPDGEDDAMPNCANALFRPEGGGRLILEEQRGACPGVVSVYVADALYEDVSVTVEFFGDGPPLLLFGDFALGSGACAWPDAPVSPLVVTRIGGEITTTDGAGSKATCNSVPRGGRSLGFRAGETTSTITSLGVKRGR